MVNFTVPTKLIYGLLLLFCVQFAFFCLLFFALRAKREKVFAEPGERHHNLVIAEQKEQELIRQRISLHLLKKNIHLFDVFVRVECSDENSVLRKFGEIKRISVNVVLKGQLDAGEARALAEDIATIAKTKPERGDTVSVTAYES